MSSVCSSVSVRAQFDPGLPTAPWKEINAVQEQSWGTFQLLHLWHSWSSEGREIKARKANQFGQEDWKCRRFLMEELSPG